MPVFFYTSEQPDKRVEGELATGEQGFSAILPTPLFPFKQIKIEREGEMVAMSFSSDPKEVTEDYLPRVAAFTDTERNIKGLLLDAHAQVHYGKMMDPGQKLTGHRWITSEKDIIEGVETSELTAHFNVPNFVFKSNTVSTAEFLAKDGAQTEIQIAPSPSENHQLGFRFILTASADMEWWMTHVVRPIESILKIATLRPVSVQSISINTLGGIAEYFEGGFDSSPIKRPQLLPLSEVNTALIAKWLEVAQHLGQVHYYASSDPINIQADALLYTSALEGFHRRLVETKDKKRKLTSGPAKRLKEKIKAAVREAYKDVEDVNEDEIAEYTSPYSSMIQSPDYEERASYFISNYYEAYPFLFGPDGDAWIKGIKKIRNEQSHLFAATDAELKVNYAPEYAAYLTYNYSLRLLLKIVMLETAGVDRRILQSSVAESEYVGYQLANLDSEEYWPTFSTLGKYKGWKKKLKEDALVDTD